MTKESLDFIYDTIDMFARNNNFVAIDNFLYMAIIDEISTDLILTLLTATLCHKSKLKQRSSFFKEAKRALGNKLVKGLE